MYLFIFFVFCFVRKQAIRNYISSVCVSQGVEGTRDWNSEIFLLRPANISMKVSPPPPPLSSVTPATEREDDDDGSTDAAAANNCGGGGGLKRRRLHSQTNVINNHYNRHRKHFYSRHDDRSSPSSTDRLNDVGGTASTGSSCNSGGDVSDCDGDPSSKAPDGGHPPTAHRHPIAAEEGTSFSPPPPPPPRIQKVR